MKIGRITVSDRASSGVYRDLGGPEIERYFRAHFSEPLEFVAAIIPDERAAISATLCEFADRHHCEFIATTGGTGVTPRDVTPEATRAVLEKELPGFGEIMRTRSFDDVPTAILSRATAGVRGRSLILNLPGKPSAIAECLDIVLPAVREAIEHLQGRDPHATLNRSPNP
jgi:molybdopterin adenylyltransferase